jgi:DUF2892 family protein
MTRNIGSTDRLIRVVVGIGLLLIAVEGPRTAWGYIGLVPLITGLAGYCPLYRLLGRKSLGASG